MLRLTPAVKALIIVNVVVFLFQQVLNITPLIALWPIGSGAFVPYQFFTYMFAHGGIGHIFFNMFALASFAPILENYWGDKKFLFFYLTTGVGAAVIYAGVHYFMSPNMEGVMLGASGSLYGVLMAFGMIFPNLEIMLLFPPIPIKAKYMVFLIGLITYAMDRSGSIAHVAHFGGALVAFVIITIWQKQGFDKR